MSHRRRWFAKILRLRRRQWLLSRRRRWFAKILWLRRRRWLLLRRRRWFAKILWLRRRRWFQLQLWQQALFPQLMLRSSFRLASNPNTNPLNHTSDQQYLGSPILTPGRHWTCGTASRGANRVAPGMWILETDILEVSSSLWAHGNGWVGPETPQMPPRKNRSIGPICCGKLKVGMVGLAARSILVGRDGRFGNDFVDR